MFFKLNINLYSIIINLIINWVIYNSSQFQLFFLLFSSLEKQWKNFWQWKYVNNNRIHIYKNYISLSFSSNWNLKIKNLYKVLFLLKYFLTSSISYRDILLLKETTCINLYYYILYICIIQTMNEVDKLENYRLKQNLMIRWTYFLIYEQLKINCGFNRFRSIKKLLLLYYWLTYEAVKIVRIFCFNRFGIFESQFRFLIF